MQGTAVFYHPPPFPRKCALAGTCTAQSQDHPIPPNSTLASRIDPSPHPRSLPNHHPIPKPLNPSRLPQTMNDVTRFLENLPPDAPFAVEPLLPRLYDELRHLAAAQLARESPGQTLQPTALVHEAWLRLVGDHRERLWNSRGHFFAAAAEAMRRILVENARRKAALKRGGNLERLDVADLDLAAPADDDQILAVHDALDRLATHDPLAANLVKLRFFGGLEQQEAARLLGIPDRTAGRRWSYARAWLFREIQRPHNP